jgi:hypothetical protein
MFDQRSTTTQASADAKSQAEPVNQQIQPLHTVLSARRRQLLKAAASAAPLIATLPSGEALANASALQCVINQQEGRGGAPAGVLEAPIPSDDTFARVPGRILGYKIQLPDGSTQLVRVYQIPELPPGTGTITVYGNNSDLWSDAPVPGTWFDISAANFAGIDNPAEFLMVYRDDPAPIGDKTDVAVTSALLPSDCDIVTGIPNWPGSPTSPTGPTSPQHCVYPLAVQASPNAAGNIALAGSCLASFAAA